MIYMEPSQLGWEPLVASWMEKKYPQNLSTASKNSIQVSKSLLWCYFYIKGLLDSECLVDGLDYCSYWCIIGSSQWNH